MNSELHEISLKNCVELIVDNRGKTAPTVATGVALIATNCVSNGALYPAKLNLRYVSRETYDTWFRAHPEPGDILLTNKGSQNGAVCLVPRPVDFCIAQDMVALRADRKKIYPLYLFASLRSELVQQRMKALNVDAVIPHLKKSDFDKLFVPLPVRRLQEWIGDSYFELSARIELFRSTNVILESIAQALFKSWFIDFDPVCAKADGREPDCMDATTAALFPDEFEESSAGRLPKGWRPGTLAEMSTLNSSAWSIRRRPDEVAYIDLASVKANVFDLPQRFTFAEAPSRARRELKAGDTLVGTVRPGNRSYGFIVEAEAGLTGSTGFAVLSPQESDVAAFVYLCATRADNIERLASLADGGAYPAVRPELVHATECVIPSEVVMTRFHWLANPLLRAIAANTKQAQTLTDVRDSLLPRLISGKLRVAEAEAQLEDALA